MPVKLGLEVDWIPGREEQIARLIGDRPWDYVIGSVHFIADRGIDHDGYDIWLSASPDEVWSRYFETLGDAAASGLFDVLAHPDLVKVWGRAKPDPPRPKREYYELAMEQIAAADVAIEVSTAGLRKPVGRALSGSRAARDAGRGGQAGVALLGRARAGVDRPRVRPGGRAAARRAASSASACSRAAQRREVPLG